MWPEVGRGEVLAELAGVLGACGKEEGERALQWLERAMQGLAARGFRPWAWEVAWMCKGWQMEKAKGDGVQRSAPAAGAREEVRWLSRATAEEGDGPQPSQGRWLGNERRPQSLPSEKHSYYESIRITITHAKNNDNGFCTTNL